MSAPGPKALIDALEYAYVTAAKLRKPVYVYPTETGYSIHDEAHPTALASVTVYGPEEPR